MKKFLILTVCAFLSVPQVWAQDDTGSTNPPDSGGQPGKAIEQRQERIDQFKEKHPNASEVIEKRQERLEQFKENHPGGGEVWERKEEKIDQFKENHPNAGEALK